MQQSAIAKTVWSAVMSMTRFPQKTNPLVTGLVIGLGFAVSAAQAAPPSVDGVPSSGTTAGSSITISHTTPSSPNRLMIVGVSFNNHVNDASKVDSVTYNGTSLSLVGTAQQTDDARVEIWSLIAPDTGTHDAVITFDANARGAVIGVITFTGVDQSTPLGTFAGANAVSGTASVDVSSAAGELVLGVVAAEDAGGLTDTGQTEYWNDVVNPGTGGYETDGAGGTEPGAATVTMSWTLGSSDYWAIGAVPIKGAGARVFNYLTTPQDVSPTSTGWQVVDVSTWVPAGATGVILQEVNPDLADRWEYGVRMNGSNDVWMLGVEGSRQDSLGFFMIGVDADRKFEVSVNNTVLKTYLLGYTMAGVTFFQTAVDMSLGAGDVGTWTDIDVGQHTGSDTAIGAVFIVNETERLDHLVGLRMKGSNDEYYCNIDKGDAEVALIGLDSNQFAQMKIDSTMVDLWLVGYVTSGAVFFQNAIPKTTAITGTYDDVDITGDLLGSDDANGAILRLVSNGEVWFGVRPNGAPAAYDYYRRLVEQKWPIVGVDANNLLEQKISATTHDLYLTGYTLGTVEPDFLADHDTGQESDAFTESGSETNAELFSFKLDPGPDTISVTSLIFRISDVAGLTSSDWAGANLEIIQDDVVVDGNIGAGETTSVGGLWVVDQAGGTITFAPSFSVSAATSYILRATFSSLSEGDRVTIVLNASDITASETVSGSTTAVTHKEGCFYVERFQQWSATDPDTWEVKDLSGAPFNVPANAVVEVAVRNSRANFERYGGVRAVGSGLDRRLLLQEAEMGGVSVVVMHVQVDASSQIRHYSDVTAEVDFVLLGYWDCGTYVEAFQSFTAGASLAWQDRDLWTYGVGSSQVAEIVMTNSDPFSEWEAGVRKKGPTRQRVLDIQEAEMGGVDTATMFVTADTTANATIQVYAEDDFSITFYLVGYFTTAPRTYNELFSSIGSPAASAFWQDIALNSFGVPAQAVAEFSLANTTLAAEHNMGVRENGSTRARLLDLQEAEAGGGDYGRMQVTADATSTIEFYQELISDPHNFFLTGYWGIPKPRVIRWSEVDPFRP